jgi:hypothetical protein
MSENEKEEEGESNLEKFASQALRLHRKGSFEFLLSQHLAFATGSEPLQKIRLVCEAAYMVPQTEAEKAVLDFNLVDTLYRVAVSFLNSRVSNIGTVRVVWSFEHTPQNFNRFILPWKRQIPLSCLAFDAREAEEKEEIMQTASEPEYFFQLTTLLDMTQHSFQTLKAEFLSWGLPKAMEIFEKLSRLIDPNIYREIVLKGKGEQASEGSLG